MKRTLLSLPVFLLAFSLACNLIQASAQTEEEPPPEGENLPTVTGGKHAWPGGEAVSLTIDLTMVGKKMVYEAG